MNTLVVIEYDDPYKAEEIRLKLHKMQKDFLIDMEDAVVAEMPSRSHALSARLRPPATDPQDARARAFSGADAGGESGSYD